MLEFDTGSVVATEFGVGIAVAGQQRDDFYIVPVDTSVQDALREMVEATWHAMQEHTEGPREYEPSEKHATNEHLFLPVGSPMIVPLVDLHNAENLPIDQNCLNDTDLISSISCYFARLTDAQGRRLTALHRAAHFKGIVTKKLIRLFDDTLRMVEDNIFRLDKDFDLIIDSEHLHIWRPLSFEILGNLTPALLAAVQANTAVIREQVPFVDFDSIQHYASKHPRAARYVASIRTQRLAGVDPVKLQQLCQKTNVEVDRDDDGRLVVAERHVLGFLEVLDRRRYEIELIPEDPESFLAASRRKV